MKWKRKDPNAMTATCQLRDGRIHPFGALQGYMPLGAGEERIYRELREAIPVLDAAIGKLVRLSGGIRVQCRNEAAQQKMDNFLRTVCCGRGQSGINNFLTGYLDSLLTYGRAIGEMVVAGGKLRAVCWGAPGRRRSSPGCSFVSPPEEGDCLFCLSWAASCIWC